MRLERVLHLVNCHTEGVVCDVLVGGLGSVPGETMMEKKAYFTKHLDHIRTMLVLEPRAPKTRSVNVLVPSPDPRADWGFLILETEEIADMSGGNIISTATVLLETGVVTMTEPITRFSLDTPAGLIPVECTCRDGKVLDVTFTNQPAFVGIRDAMIEVPELGSLRVDVAWGGMWYLILDAADVGMELVPAEHARIVRLGEAIKSAARQQLHVVHPENPDLGRPEVGGIQCTMFAGPLHSDADGSLRSRNAVVVSPGWIDRCPCGTGTSARLALLSERGQMGLGQQLTHESLIGTKFVADIAGHALIGAVSGVVPRVRGRAWITGTSQVGVDPTDPFPNGFSMETLAAASVVTRL